MATLFTIGHSTRTLEELIQALQAHSIGTLADIRTFPMSRRLPHFNREALEKTLPAAGIQYVWMKELGGRRKKTLADSPNIALRNDSFRNYADYMLTPEFELAIAQLVKIGESSRTAYMCAERVYCRCHRMLVFDWLVAHGHEVLHIDDAKPARPHTLLAEAKMEGDKLIYRGRPVTLAGRGKTWFTLKDRSGPRGRRRARPPMSFAARRNSKPQAGRKRPCKDACAQYQDSRHSRPAAQEVQRREDKYRRSHNPPARRTPSDASDPETTGEGQRGPE